MAVLQSKWKEFWCRLGAQGDARKIFNDLVSHYSEPHRAYHNLAHIEHCLTELSEAESLANHWDAVEFAVWFHDAIYNSHAADNEEQSAELALRVIHGAALPKSFGEWVTQLILATKRHESSVDTDVALMLDVDLSILGQPAERFDRYEAEIRSEYAWVPDPVFRSKRVEILTAFLSRPAIYQTGHFRRKYEQTARGNLQRSIDRLS